MLHGMVGLSHTQPIHLSFRQPSDIRLGLMQRRKEYDSERVGCRIESDAGKSQMAGGHRERKVFVVFVPLLFARKSADEKGGIGGRE